MTAYVYFGTPQYCIDIFVLRDNIEGDIINYRKVLPYTVIKILFSFRGCTAVIIR